MTFDNLSRHALSPYMQSIRYPHVSGLDVSAASAQRQTYEHQRLGNEAIHLSWDAMKVFCDHAPLRRFFSFSLFFPLEAFVEDVELAFSPFPPPPSSPEAAGYEIRSPFSSPDFSRASFACPDGTALPKFRFLFHTTEEEVGRSVDC